MNSLFKKWKTLRVSYCKNAVELDSKLKGASVIFNQSRFINKINLKSCEINTSVDLVKIDTSELKQFGITLQSSDEKIRNHFLSLGLKKLDIQTTVQLAISYRPQKEQEVIRIITDPIFVDGQKLEFIFFKNLAKKHLSLVEIKSLTRKQIIYSSLIFQRE